MAELHAYFTNCPIGGEERTDYGDHWSCDTIRVRHRGFEFRIVQKRDVLVRPRDFDHANVVTTDVYVREVTEKTVDRVERLLHELAWLLSLATYSDVAYSGYDFAHGTKLGEHRSTIGRLRHFRPPLETADGAAVREFLERTWPVFTKVWARRRLHIVIHYVLLADRHEQPTEVRLLLVFVALEALKSSYARISKIPLVAGRFRKLSVPPKANSRSEPSYSFEELLRLMLKEVGMGRAALKRPIQLRNAIVHSGITRAHFDTDQTIYERCQDIIREYLLRLLGFRGRFWLYSAPNGAPKIIQ